MRLSHVDIENFRSIRSQMIDFSPSCRILVGINETGKSNIIHALRLLSSEFEVADGDVRDTLPSDQDYEDASSYIRFVFSLDKADYLAIVDLLWEKMLSKKSSATLMTGSNGPVKLLDCVKNCAKEGLYVVQLRTKTKLALNWVYNTSYPHHSNWKANKIPTHWRAPKADMPDAIVAQDAAGNSVQVNNFELIDIRDYPDIPDQHLDSVSKEMLHKIIGSCIREIIDENLPEVLYWDYSPEFLLPDSVNIEEFKNDPDSCVPLKHMFHLADISEPGEAIETAASRRNGMDHLLHRISKRTTAHIRAIWKEYKNLTIELRDKGERIEMGVRESNFYSFDRRSDGFKRFVTFLLMISARDRIDDLENTLILFDEPDVGLHPSGAQHLLEELIKLSRRNVVVFTTHSIFMIDKERINRHLIVKKKKEVTTFKEAGASNYSDEEVVFKALNYSIFENLKARNIIFEGWKDKQVYLAFLRSSKQSVRKLKATLKTVGYCHSQGVSKITRLTAIFEAGKRDCLIVTDSDDAAKDAQKAHSKNHDYGDWKTYDDLGAKNKITSEDFIKIKRIASAAKSLLEQYPGLAMFDSSKLGDGGRWKVLDNWLQKGGLQGSRLKAARLDLKDMIFENLKPKDIEDDYLGVMEKICEQIKPENGESQKE